MRDDKASQTDIFTQTRLFGQQNYAMSFLSHFYFKLVLSSNTQRWLANIYYSLRDVAEVPAVFTKYQFFLTHLSCFVCCMINILRQMKKNLIELMNRLQSIDWYDGLDESIFFFLVFFLEKTAFDLLAFCSLQRD